MKHKKAKKPKKAVKKTISSKRFLEVRFGISSDAHPQIYNFFLEEISAILKRIKQPSAMLNLVRLEPLNTMYSHLNVSHQLMNQIFLKYCKTHKLKPFSAFTPKQKFSCRGNIRSNKINDVMNDYNMLFDMFFCDIRVETKKLFIDCMDLFSNQLLVHSDIKTLKQFQKLVKKALPKTKFHLE